MPPINPSEMGDVWPAAEPGRPGDYGSASLHPTDPVEIRSYQTLTVTYTVGKFGLDGNLFGNVGLFSKGM